MPVTWREEYPAVDGVKLLCRVGGDGPHLLVLHGADGGDGLLPFHDGLAASFRVVAPSLPGFGHTALPEWMDSVDDLAYFCLDLLEKLALTEANLLGIGFGGWIAAEMAVRSHQRLRRLV